MNTMIKELVFVLVITPYLGARVEAKKNVSPSPPSAAVSRPSFQCGLPSEVLLNQWFTIDCYLLNSDVEALITADTNENVEYRPAKFSIRRNRTELIRVRIKRAEHGVVALTLFPDHYYEQWWAIVDLGFVGHLRPPQDAPTLSYNTPATMSFEVVDDHDKAIPLQFGLRLKVQAIGAQLSSGKQEAGAPPEWKETIPLPLTARATASPQFQVRSTAWKGGTIRLMASVETAVDEPIVLTQSNFSFRVNPAWWLPIVLAVSGSLLYWLYSFARKPKISSVIVPEIMASIIGGLIAYLFAGFDLLGLKLDPNVLRTYPLLGFLFAYAGIEALLGTRFRGGQDGNDRVRQNTATPGPQ